MAVSFFFYFRWFHFIRDGVLHTEKGPGRVLPETKFGIPPGCRDIPAGALPGLRSRSAPDGTEKANPGEQRICRLRVHGVVVVQEHDPVHQHTEDPAGPGGRRHRQGARHADAGVEKQPHHEHHRHDVSHASHASRHLLSAASGHEDREVRSFSHRAHARP